MTDADPPSDSEPESRPEPQSSGLRNPKRAVAALGAMVLGAEALMLLLAVVPLRMLLAERSGPAVAAVLTLAAIAALLAGFVRRDWAWPAGLALQAAVAAAGLVHWALLGVALIFGAAWLYAMWVRRLLSRAPQREAEE